MAYLSKPSKASKQAVLHTATKAGFAMVPTHVDGETLPVAVIAPENSLHVYVGLIPPDKLSRPTPDSDYVYKTSFVSNVDPNTSFSDPYVTTGGWVVGKSIAYNPTSYSGERIGLHSECTVTVTSGCFAYSADIIKEGTKIRVGANGVWTAASADTYVVGEVDHYDADLNELTIAIWR